MSTVMYKMYPDNCCVQMFLLKISKKFRKDQIETNSYRIEVEGCCYISIYFLKYWLRVGIFYRIFKMDDFSSPKNMHYYKDKKLIRYIDFDKMVIIGGNYKDWTCKSCNKILGLLKVRDFWSLETSNWKVKFTVMQLNSEFDSHKL